MSFTSILESYRKMSRNEREKGQRFEVLMKHFLKTAPLYKQDIEEVWLWNEFPFRKDFGGADLGIDLVTKPIQGIIGPSSASSTRKTPPSRKRLSAIL